MKTYLPKAKEYKQEWIIVDAEQFILGRLATFIAGKLRGKDRVDFTPHLDLGAHVIVINSAKIQVTGSKETRKKYHDHSGYMGGLKEQTLATIREKDPNRIITDAVRRMLPRNTLSQQILKKLHVFADAKHTHSAQQPTEIKAA